MRSRTRRRPPPRRVAETGRAPASPSGALLFTYGTLMRGFPLHRLLTGAAEYCADATAPARLLDLGRYPGAVPDPRATVRGELYRVLHPALWTALDSAEGPQYDRGRVEVGLDDGGRVGAFIYWYVGPLDRGIPIPGGDYRAHAPARSVHRSVRAEEAMAWRLTRPS